MNEQPRILIVKLSAIGDCLLASPTAQALRETFPQAKLGWIVHSHCSAVVNRNPYLNEVHHLPRKNLLSELLKLRPALKSAGYETAVDLQGLFKSGLVAKLSGSKRRIGPVEAREGAGIFYTEKVSRHYGEIHVITGYLGLAKAAGAKVEREPPMLMPFGQEELSYADQLLGDKQFFVLNPSAGKPNKQWATERFGAVGAILREKFGLVPVITGAPSDRELADRVISTLGEPYLDVTGKTNLNQLAAVLSKAKLFIGGDTGPMHIAQAAGTRVLAIFGPTNPVNVAPRDPKHRTIFELDSEGHRSLDLLSIETVAAAASEML